MAAQYTRIQSNTASSLGQRWIFTCHRKLRNMIIYPCFNKSWPSDAIWRHGSRSTMGNGMMPDGTKALREPAMTNHQWVLLVFTRDKFCRKCSRYLSLIWICNLLMYDYSHISADFWTISVLVYKVISLYVDVTTHLCSKLNVVIGNFVCSRRGTRCT